jgi:hypothetical protein
MTKETFIVNGRELEDILDSYHLEYGVINMHYKFIGVDHDLWEFQAIVQRTSDHKYFSVNWFDNYTCNWSDNYACNWSELGLNDDNFELTEVTPKQIMTTIYE